MNFNHKTNNEFHAIIDPLISDRRIQQLKQFSHHIRTTRYDHSLHVALVTYRLCHFFHANTLEAVQAAMMHDLFFYEWRDHRDIGPHTKVHPIVACENAKQILPLTPLMEDAIVNHMWPLSGQRPSYIESWIISIVDKYCAAIEYISTLQTQKRIAALLFLFSFVNL